MPQQHCGNHDEENSEGTNYCVMTWKWIVVGPAGGVAREYYLAHGLFVNTFFIFKKSDNILDSSGCVAFLPYACMV